MSVYNVINDLTGDSVSTNIYAKVEAARTQIFDFSYPIWNEEYRATLENKILFHYFDKEICVESLARWQLFLYERLNLIMPYYNKMYLSTIQNFDITKDHNITSTDSETDSNTIETTNTNTNTVTGITNSEEIECNTPQARLTEQDYASFITNNKGNNTQTATGTNTNTTTNTNTKANSHTESGHNIPIADLLVKYRDSLINIDSMIIEELHDLFMLIY